MQRVHENPLFPMAPRLLKRRSMERLDDATLSTMLGEARELARRLEALAEHDNPSLNLRLACAHALGTVDQLEEELRRRGSGTSRAA